MIRYPLDFQTTGVMASNPVKDVNESDVTSAAEESLDFGDNILRG